MAGIVASGWQQPQVPRTPKFDPNPGPSPEQLAAQNAASQQVQAQNRSDQQTAQARADATMARSNPYMGQSSSYATDTDPARTSQQEESPAGIAQREDTAAKGMLQEQARLQAEAEARRLAQLSGLSKTTTSGGGTPSGGGVPAGPDPAVAQANAFAAAKDKAGLTARASLNALYDVMAGQGRSGSGAEGAGAASVINQGQGDINDFIRDQYGADVERANDVADRNYAGDITKQGQALGQQASLMGLITARGLY